jgi:hypothetical protein
VSDLSGLVRLKWTVCLVCATRPDKSGRRAERC